MTHSPMDELHYRSSARSFLGEEAWAAGPPQDARAVVIPFPLEATTSFGKGTERGAEAIIAASNSLEAFDDELGFSPLGSFGLATLETAEIPRSLEGSLDQIEHLASAVLSAEKFPLTLGGEHSLTIGALRAFAAQYPELAVLHFDAHADLRDSYQGERFSHACVMRRALEHQHINLVSVGVRSISQGEMAFLNARPDRIAMHWARDRAAWDAVEIVRPLAGKPIYLSFDVDAFDASLMPATGTPEPGGLFFDDACTIIRAASMAGTIVGADLVELAPIPGMTACDVTTAKLAYKILGYALGRDGGG
jgi:agmatinase